MRNTTKVTTLESKFPLLAVEQGCIVSKDADITVAFRVELPELFTVTSAEYEAMHAAWHKAVKVLPDFTIVHKQDWFVKERYAGRLSDGELSFLARASERHFNERPFLDHACYLFLTKTTRQRMARQSNFSSLCRGTILPKEVGNREEVAKFMEAVDQPEPSEEVPAAIGRSIDKYEETTRELESFYDLPAVEDDDVKRELNALRAELGALKEEKAKANGEVDQLELLEKSYQMAAKYLPSGNATPNPSANSSDKSVKPPASELPAAELSPERETVVSSLDQPISDSAFIAEYGYKERNLSFHSVGKATPSIARNTLSVVVDRTTTIRQGDFLRLRLAESARIEGMTLP